jgi:hypothetical protein
LKSRGEWQRERSGCKAENRAPKAEITKQCSRDCACPAKTNKAEIILEERLKELKNATRLKLLTWKAEII